MTMQSEMMQSPGVKITGILVLIVLAVFLGAKTITEFIAMGTIGDDQPAQHTISVEAQGTATATPDTAEFSFAVVEEAETVGAAQDRATDKINEAISFLTDQGIAESDIKTLGYNVSPQYDFIRPQCRDGLCPPNQRRLSGFEVRQRVEVSTKDLENVGTLFSGLGNIGVGEVSSLRFTVENEDELTRQARDEAITQAKEKAERLADQLGVELGRVVSFNERGGGPRPYQERAFAADAGAGGGTPQVPTGENEITSSVNIQYEIE